MQDRGIGEQFTNQAWEQMKQLLDEEMPVAKKKRKRGLLWLLFFLIGLSIGGGFAGFWSYYQKEEQAIVANNTRIIPPAESNKKNKPANKVEIPEKKPRRTLDENPITQEHIALTKIKTQAAKRNNSTSSSSVNKKAPSINPIENAHTELKKQNQLMSSIPEDLRGGAFKNRISIETIDRLNFSIDYLNHPKYVFIPLKKTVNKVSNPGKFSLGAELGLLTNGNNLFAGGMLSIIGQYKWNDRWAISSGMGYSILTTQIKYSTNSNLASDEFSTPVVTGDPTTSGGNNGNPDTEGSSVDQPDPQTENERAVALPNRVDLDLQYFQLPIWGSFYFKKWLRLDFGAQFSYVNSINRSGNALEDNFQSSLNTSFNQYRSIFDTNGEVNTMKIRRFGIGLLSGISFWPSEDLGINLHYHHGLSPISKIDNYRTTNQHIKLSAIYLF